MARIWRGSRTLTGTLGRYRHPRHPPTESPMCGGFVANPYAAVLALWPPGGVPGCGCAE